MTEVIITKSDRGFKDSGKIEAAYGGYAQVRESSAAMNPHLWLYVAEPVDLNGYAARTNMELKEVSTLHLSAAQARQLRDTLDDMLINHYHGDCSQEGLMKAEDNWFEEEED